MNVFYEFYKVAKKLREARIPYAIVGGVAMAFYSKPRFTKDIDILVKGVHIEKILKILKEEGYFESAPPWKFKKVPIMLHRFLKVEGQDEIMLDILMASNARYSHMIDKAYIARSRTLGNIRVIRKKDLIRMKRLRNSKLDKVDIDDLHE